MPPKNKFTREQIIAAALSIAETNSIEALTARSLAAALGASAKPIFGYFQNMQQLQQEVIRAANAVYTSYISSAMHSGDYPPYKASGMAYIQFAKEKPQLFKLLFMRDRSAEPIPEDREAVRPILDILIKNLALDENEAYLFHLELCIFVHGIATMAATAYLDWDMDFISRALTDAYQGLKHRFAKE